MFFAKDRFIQVRDTDIFFQNVSGIGRELFGGIRQFADYRQRSLLLNVAKNRQSAAPKAEKTGISYRGDFPDIQKGMK